MVFVFPVENGVGGNWNGMITTININALKSIGGYQSTLYNINY